MNLYQQKNVTIVTQGEEKIYNIFFGNVIKHYCLTRRLIENPGNKNTGENSNKSRKIINFNVIHLKLSVRNKILN